MPLHKGLYNMPNLRQKMTDKIFPAKIHTSQIQLCCFVIECNQFPFLHLLGTISNRHRMLKQSSHCALARSPSSAVSATSLLSQLMTWKYMLGCILAIGIKRYKCQQCAPIQLIWKRTWYSTLVKSPTNAHIVIFPARSLAIIKDIWESMLSPLLVLNVASHAQIFGI